jgi:secreted Zn-dependent insulinase-like peptidase
MMRLLSGFILLLLAPFALAAEIPTPPPPLKAPGDQTAYRHLVLDNGLRVILVSNPKLNLSSVALAVDAGSFDNPDARPGLAHYLEHLVFLGTDKFPDPGEFDKYIQANGGSNNAYTASDHTNYHLEISHAAFEGALERLSRFFIAPRFDADFCDREVTAIQNEFERHRDNDFARLEFVAEGLYDPAAPDARFSIGNRATLAGTPREEVIAFYQSRYSADHMALALCGPAGLDQLEALARRYFAEIPRRPVAPHTVAGTAFLPRKAAVRTVQIPSAKENPRLVLQFPVGPTRTDFAAKPVELVTSLLATGGAGSLLAQLKAEDLAVGLTGELDERAADHSAYFVVVDLTANGRAHTDRVLQLFFAYARMLQSAPYPLGTFNERAAFARRDEAFVDRGEGNDLASGLARAALHYPLELAERIPFLWLTPDEAAYRRVLDTLKPDNTLVILLAPDLTGDREEKYYGFKYSYAEQTGAAFAALAQNPPEATVFALPAANPFAAANTTVLATRPVRIVDEPGLTMAYAQEGDLARPQVTYRFFLRPGTTTLGAKATVRLALFETALQLALQDLEADAGAAGIQYAVVANSGLYLFANGYSGSTERFFAQLVERTATLALDERTFAAVRDQVVNELASFPRAEAFQAGRAHLRALLNTPAFLPSDLLAAARTVTREEVLATIPNLFSTGQIDGLACGNVDPAEAARLARLLRSRLHTAPAADAEVVRPRYLQLAAGETVVDADTLIGQNSFTALYYLYPTDTPELRAAAGLIGNFIGDDFYADLRTHQQLGYIVSARSATDTRALATLGIVQSSEYPSDELRRRIETYFADLGRRWAALTPEQFATLREGLRTQLAIKPNNAAERSDTLFKLAYDFGGDWDQTPATLAALDALTPERVGQIIAELVAPATRRLVVVQLTAKEHVLKEPPVPTFTDREVWKKKQTYR